MVKLVIYHIEKYYCENDGGIRGAPLTSEFGRPNTVLATTQENLFVLLLTFTSREKREANKQHLAFNVTQLAVRWAEGYCYIHFS